MVYAFVNKIGLLVWVSTEEPNHVSGNLIEPHSKQD